MEQSQPTGSGVVTIRVYRSLVGHIYYTSYAVSLLHYIEGFLYILQIFPMRDEFIHLQLPRHPVIHKPWKLRPALHTTKSAALPYSPRDQLEGCCDVSTADSGGLGS